MHAFRLGKFSAREVQSAEDYADMLALRGVVFRKGGNDEDAFDERCRHFLVRNESNGEAVCSFRFMILSGGAKIHQAYSTQFYDLSRIANFQGKMIEIGRFCTLPEKNDPDILRAAWGALTQLVDALKIEMLFGCTSFPGTNPQNFRNALLLLKERHLAPENLNPGVKMDDIFLFTEAIQGDLDIKRATKEMPPLLRTYLSMGGWVSDHAVIDGDLGTIHVFTGLEVSAIPPARKRLLRALVAESA